MAQMMNDQELRAKLAKKLGGPRVGTFGIIPEASPAVAPATVTERPDTAGGTASASAYRNQNAPVPQIDPEAMMAKTRARLGQSTLGTAPQPATPNRPAFMIPGTGGPLASIQAAARGASTAVPIVGASPNGSMERPDTSANNLRQPTQAAGGGGGYSGPPDTANDAIQKVLENNRRRDINSAYARALSSSSLPNYGGNNEARIADIQDLRRQKIVYDTANAPVPNVQDAVTIANGHNSLGIQGQNMADTQMKAAQDDIERATKTGDQRLLVDAQGRFRDALGMKERFQKWSPMSAVDAVPHMNAQEAAAQDQADRKTGAQRLIAAQTARDLEARGAGYQIEDARRQQAVDEAKGSAARAAIMKDPETIKNQIASEANRAKLDAATSASALKEGMVKTASSDRTAAQIDPEYQQARGRILSSIAKFGGGGYLGSDRAGEADQLAKDAASVQSYIATLPPDQAASAKAEIAAALNAAGVQNGPSLTDQAYQLGDTVQANVNSFFGPMSALLNPVGFAGGQKMVEGKTKRAINTKKYRDAVSGLRSWLNQ